MISLLLNVNNWAHHFLLDFGEVGGGDIWNFFDGSGKTEYRESCLQKYFARLFIE